MKTIKIDNKEYIEYRLHKWVKMKTVLNVLFIILLVVSNVQLYKGIQAIWDNRELLDNEPVSYILSRYDMASCSCVDFEGNAWTGTEEGIDQPEHINPFKINLEDLT